MTSPSAPKDAKVEINSMNMLVEERYTSIERFLGKSQNYIKIFKREKVCITCR